MDIQIPDIKIEAYTPEAILIKAIGMHYQYYMQMALPDPLKFDLRRNTRDLVIALYYHGIMRIHKKLWKPEEAPQFVDSCYELFQEIEEIIATNSIGKGHGYANKFLDEAYGWMSEVVVPILMSGYFHAYRWPSTYAQSTELYKSRKEYKAKDEYN